MELGVEMSRVESSPRPDAPRKSGRTEPDNPPEIVVKVSWCKGCGLCVEYCNRDVLEMDGVLPKVIHPEKCTRCLQCEVICPDFAIEVKDGEIQAVESGKQEQR